MPYYDCNIFFSIFQTGQTNSRGHYEVAEFLLKKGASPNSEFKSIYQGQPIKITPTFLAIFRNNIAIMKLLITHGADLNFKNYVEKDSRFQGHGLLFQVFRMNFDFFFFQKTTKFKVTNIFLAFAGYFIQTI